MNSIENPSSHYPKVNIRVTREDTGEVLYTGHNTVTDNCKWLFARMCANVLPTDPNPPYPLGHEPQYGIWGLAFGAGSPLWAPETQPQEVPTQAALVQEFLRKPLSRINFVKPDNNGGWTPVTTISTYVEFQCVVNPTTDSITQGIRELGLIGGGTTSPATDMQHAQYYTGNPSNYRTVADALDTVVLFNYKTLAPLLLPGGINVQFAFIFSF